MDTLWIHIVILNLDSFYMAQNLQRIRQKKQNNVPFIMQSVRGLQVPLSDRTGLKKKKKSSRCSKHL